MKVDPTLATDKDGDLGLRDQPLQDPTASSACGGTIKEGGLPGKGVRLVITFPMYIESDYGRRMT